MGALMFMTGFVITYFMFRPEKTPEQKRGSRITFIAFILIVIITIKLGWWGM